MSAAAQQLLEEALGCVERECAAAFAGMRAALAGRCVQLSLPGESFIVSLEALAVQEPALRIETSARVIHQLVMGELDVLEAIRMDRLKLTGSTASLADGFDAALLFLKGVTRCLSADALLRRLEQLSYSEGMS